MDSFFRSVGASFGNLDHVIRESLMGNLSENIKEIQFEFSADTNEDVTLELCECTSSLCTTVEAIFLHGLKDSFLRQTINVIAGEIDRRPEPNFWPPLMIFTHKQTIAQIQSFSQVNTDIGYSRTWIRQALNDSLLSAYLANIRRNVSALSPYYKRHAFLRDADKMELAERIVAGGLESSTFIFTLPTNSSLLNQWTYHPLQMAGLYTPPLRACPIASGFDVASGIIDGPTEAGLTTNSATLPIPAPRPVQTNTIFSSSISNSPFATRIGNDALTENIDDNDENLNSLLRKVEAIEQNQHLQLNAIAIAPDVDAVAADDASGYHSMVNSMTGKLGWQETDINEATRPRVLLSRSSSMTQSIGSVRSPVDRHSYNSLLASHIKKSGRPAVDLKEVWSQFEASLGIADGTGIIGVENDAITTDCGFEFVGNSSELAKKLSLTELQEMVEQSCRIARELGIDSQGFACRGCPTPLSVGIATAAQVCAFSGSYYCEPCMSTELNLIPARVIYNWDFRKYPVSKRAAAFLSEFQFQPFIDLKLLNPDIYQAVHEMAVLQSLRIQLNFIRAYLFTCSGDIMAQLAQCISPKEYMYEHIHRYAIGDLTLMSKGSQLASQLHKTVQFGREHVRGCALCSQKGFICEVCNDRDNKSVLYPFDIETTFRCDLCGSVFHADCLDSSRPCPKCERKRRRYDVCEVLTETLLLEETPSQRQLEEAELQ